MENRSEKIVTTCNYIAYDFNSLQVVPLGSTSVAATSLLRKIIDLFFSGFSLRSPETISCIFNQFYRFHDFVIPLFSYT